VVDEKPQPPAFVLTTCKLRVLLPDILVCRMFPVMSYNTQLCDMRKWWDQRYEKERSYCESGIQNTGVYTQCICTHKHTKQFNFHRLQFNCNQLY
jgi:hypothetical protein